MRCWISDIASATRMHILGLNSAYHESAACLVLDGEVRAAVEEERFTRFKHAKRASVDNPHELPECAIAYCLAVEGIGIEDVDHIGYSLEPELRLTTSDLEHGLPGDEWGTVAGETAFYQNLMRVPGALRDMGFRGQFRWLNHHVCHGASAFFPSPFDRAAVLTVDGIGETGSAAFAVGEGGELRPLSETSYPTSLGFLWETVAQFLGFTQYDACKVMGMAAYGDPDRYSEQTDRILQTIPNGSFLTNNEILRFRRNDLSQLEKLFGIAHRSPSADLEHAHYDIAAALQRATNAVMVHLAEHALSRTGADNLCMAGGVALNCVANSAVLQADLCEGLFIQPVAHDAGAAIGAALSIWHSLPGSRRSSPMEHTYLGPEFSDEEVRTSLTRNGVEHSRVPDIERLAARLLSEGSIVGWFQGALEMGPRALGNRSLLADPRNRDSRNVINARVKHRPSFMPFAPSVLAEEADEWFEMGRPTPAAGYMLVAYPALERTKELVPAVVHEDGTSRVQTVREDVNPRYHRLISEFRHLTGVPIVLNTSFNDSEPIVCSPEDAILTALKTGIDYLAIGDFIAATCDLTRKEFLRCGTYRL